MTRPWQELFEGTEVVCIASGPSLTKADVELVRQWRAAAEDRRVIVTNTTFRLALWADVLYAMDRVWWRQYRKEAEQTFEGVFATNSRSMEAHGMKTVQRSLRKFKPYQNSGAAAISLACKAGAQRVIMLGYDCQHTGGKRHWHGDHPRGMGNAKSVNNWGAHFKAVRRDFANANIVNATRTTALTVFPKEQLENALWGKMLGGPAGAAGSVVGSILLPQVQPA